MSPPRKGRVFTTAPRSSGGRVLTRLLIANIVNEFLPETISAYTPDQLKRASMTKKRKRGIILATLSVYLQILYCRSSRLTKW
mmetsp:Transcript_8407/g.9306  ORF Transcript_8407/g.9306 Transcript_8407/m.9306 type:complete len:83 (+) Transcript_8407:1-249(+)